MARFNIVPLHPRIGTSKLPWPARETKHAAGYECAAAIEEPLKLWPGRLVEVPLGFSLTLPQAWEAQIRPMRGLTSRGIIMPNSPGTVDADYRGEVSAFLYNLETQRFPLNNQTCDVFVPENGWHIIKPGDRICRIVFCMVGAPTAHPGTLDELNLIPRDRAILREG